MSGSTVDYGNNWTRFTPPLPNFNETVQILFSDEMNGYLLIKNSILKTTDQGLNWVKKTLPLTGDAKGMIFLDENIGFVWGKAMNILLIHQLKFGLFSRKKG